MYEPVLLVYLLVRVSSSSIPGSWDRSRFCSRTTTDLTCSTASSTFPSLSTSSRHVFRVPEVRPHQSRLTVSMPRTLILSFHSSPICSKIQRAYRFLARNMPLRAKASKTSSIGWGRLDVTVSAIFFPIRPASSSETGSLWGLRRTKTLSVSP